MKNIALILLVALSFTTSAATKENAMKPEQWNTLTDAEARVIVHKGTEPPFSGVFDLLTEAGIYTCRRCGIALYRSDNKFDAKCGWPAFDAEVPGAVIRKPDRDSRRIEIVCAGCDGHLGHVFTGERFTRTNTRHCVNSISMSFIPSKAIAENFDRAVFAGGCFWGVEYYLQQAPGVIYVTSGYTGGTRKSPTYEQVCSGTTGHAEAVQVIFDPKQTTFKALGKLFFEIHDPTQLNRQGPDVGDQYRSAVFVTDDAQQKTTEALIETLKAKGFAVETTVEPLGQFWPAEPVHQDYYFRKGTLPYCHQRVLRFDTP